MNSKEFYDTVVKLRNEQKTYFRTKSPLALKASKELEKKIDDEIDRVNRILDEQRQQRMF